MNYNIFKTNLDTGKTYLICGGSHERYEDCARHFRAYSFGFMDCAEEICGHDGYLMTEGNHVLSFLFKIKGKEGEFEYFMLLDQEGQDLLNRIA